MNSKTRELKITLLHGAATFDNLEMIRLLIKHQVDLNATDNLRVGTALSFAQDCEESAAVELLKELATS